MRALRLRRGRRADPDSETPDPRAGMLASAPVPLDWERFADRRPRRLKRGKHFVGEPKILQREAEHAAKGMGKVALVSKDQQGKYGYLWVQFVDAAVDEGEPCPVCDSYELLKLNNDVIRCPSCDSMLEFKARPLEMPALPTLQIPAGASAADASPADDAPEARGAPRYDVSELADIVSTRTLRADGSVGESFSTDEPITVETIIRSHQPRLRISVKVAAQVGDQPVLVTRQPEWPELTRAGLHTVSVHLPAYFLMSHSYRLKVAVKVADGAPAGPITVISRKAIDIALQPREGAPGPSEAFVRPAFEWTTESVDTDEVDDDFDVFEDD